MPEYRNFFIKENALIRTIILLFSIVKLCSKGLAGIWQKCVFKKQHYLKSLIRLWHSNDSKNVLKSYIHYWFVLQ
jgi:hypothetical protein